MENRDIRAVAPSTLGTQGARGERPSEVETVDCMEDRMKILRSKKEFQQEGMFYPA